MCKFKPEGGYKTVNCPRCNAKGEVPRLVKGRSHVFETSPCPQCHGNGYIYVKENTMKSLGRTAYESRFFGGPNPIPAAAPAWDTLPNTAKDVWARVESAVVSRYTLPRHPDEVEKALDILQEQFKIILESYGYPEAKIESTVVVSLSTDIMIALAKK